MKILISLEHPAWVHQFKHILSILHNRGHQILIAAIDKDITTDLLDNIGYKYNIISNSSGNNIFEKMIIFFKSFFNLFILSLRFKPDIYIGRASPMLSINSFIFNKPNLVYADTEHSNVSLFFSKFFSTVILSPDSFRKNLGSKHIKIPTYKELAYLHPKYFTPDSSVLDRVGLNSDDRFIIIRFVSFTAHHDFGQYGIINKEHLTKKLEQYVKVFITSEKKLPNSFEKYEISVPYTKFHDLLSYATLYVGEGGTIASEAAVLGVHSILASSLGKECGVFFDQAKYGLQYICESDDSVIKIAEKLLLNKDLRTIGKIKQKKLLRDKIDFNYCFIHYIEKYSQDIKLRRQIPYG